MESVDTFRGCDTGEKNKEAMVVSMEMVAKCLCNIPHGDYVELKEQLGFQHNDRYMWMREEEGGGGGHVHARRGGGVGR